MKKLMYYAAVLLLLSFVSFPVSISDKERKLAVDFLTDTENGVFNAVKGLSDAQLKFKAAPDRWSAEECVKHIAISESNIWSMVQKTLNQPANPEKRAEIKATDEQVIKMIEDRSRKVKTSETFEPQNTPYKSISEALDSFKVNRDKLVEYVKTTNDDLRNHVAAGPVGHFDSYQMILFIGAHSKRHTLQIDEVKADPNFPKN